MMFARFVLSWFTISILICYESSVALALVKNPPEFVSFSPRRATSALYESKEDYSYSDYPQHSYLATCLPGLSGILQEELRTIEGVADCETSGVAAVRFCAASLEPALEALLWVRTAHRFMEFIGEADGLATRDDLYEAIQDIVDVKSLLGDGKGGLLTLSVQVKASGGPAIPKDLSHSHYSALTIKNALVDAVRDLRGDRPSVDIQQAQVPLMAMLRPGRNRDGGASLSLYRCLHPPGSLHRRGYRQNLPIHRASMKESMAAGLVLLSELESDKEIAPNRILVDPMAGSGSLVLEAAMIHADVAPGLMRIKCGQEGHRLPPVLHWKSSQEEDATRIWKDLLVQATERAKRGISKCAQDGPIFWASDVHEGALSILKSSLEQAGLQNIVRVRQGDCRDWDISYDINLNKDVCVLTNPPWGVRLTDEMHESWEALRTFLRSNPSISEAWVLSGNKESTKHLGLRRSKSIPLQTADQHLRWIQYKILHGNDKPVSTTRRTERQYNGDEDHRAPREEKLRSTKQEDVDDDDEIGYSRMPREEWQKKSRFGRSEYTREHRPRNTVTREETQAEANGDAHVRSDDIRQDPQNKSVTRALTNAERKERKNSWLL